MHLNLSSTKVATILSRDGLSEDRYGTRSFGIDSHTQVNIWEHYHVLPLGWMQAPVARIMMNPSTEGLSTKMIYQQEGSGSVIKYIFIPRQQSICSSMAPLNSRRFLASVLSNNFRAFPNKTLDRLRSPRPDWIATIICWTSIVVWSLTGRRDSAYLQIIHWNNWPQSCLLHSFWSLQGMINF